MDILRRIPYYGMLALLVYMPFHIFLAQSLSLATGGLEVWKVAKDVFVFGLVLFGICLVFINRAGQKWFYWLLGLSVLYGVIHLLLWAANLDIFKESAILGLVHNLRLPGFALIGAAAVLLNKDKFVFSLVIKIVLIVSTIVALIAVVQYFLPKDILTHFGYSLERGARPAFFIDDNPTLPRVFSTLREPNALGAYLIIPVCLLLNMAIRAKGSAGRLRFWSLFLLHMLALVLAFSRSAWLGAALAITLVLLWSLRDVLLRTIRRFWPFLLAAAVLLAVGLYQVHDLAFIQGYITHATVDETNDLDSNDYHALLLREGLEGVADKPFGHGPGTAGLASIRSPGGGQLTENYFVQIAYEVGLAGLALFATLLVFVYLALRRQKSWVTTSLLASFWGYIVMNMLLHTWSNEAVAAQWWLLAGAIIVYGQSASTKNREAF